MSSPKQIILEECKPEEATHFLYSDGEIISLSVSLISKEKLIRTGWLPYRLVDSTPLTNEQARKIAEMAARKKIPNWGYEEDDILHNIKQDRIIAEQRQPYIDGIMDVLLNQLPE